VQKGEVVTGEEWVLRNSDGRRLHVLCNAAPIRDAHGQIFSGVIVWRDITDRKRIEEALRELNENLEAQVAERTALAERRARDLRRLAAELSEAEHRERKRLAELLHDDLQQLLLAIKLRLPVLVEGDPSQLKEHVERLDQLVGECLSTSRNLTQELSPPVLQYGTLAEVVEWLGGWFGEKHGLTLTLEAPDELPATPEHLRVFLFQAVRELLVNVVKHSGNMEARIALSCQEACLTVQVEDGGSGFDPQAVQSQLQRPEGFGLFNIRERLEALLGRLEIRTTPQGGACFRLVVPVVEETPLLPGDIEPLEIKMTPSRARESYSEGDVLRLVVADDHAVVREGFVGLLDRQLDFDVVGEAADGEEAVQQAKALCPDAIVMDVDMPTVNGIEATRRIKQRQPDTVIIGLSLHEEESVARAMYEAGADAYVGKHAPAKDLIEAIRRACSRDGGTQ
jgi:signal transduction histidine kinase/ActR/RegA family two-component response regulator